MAEENIRSRGVVVRFNEQKGYIFIKPDGGGDNLFVHHTKIKSDGYRTLCEGQTVEFLVKLNNNKTILTLPLLTRFATVAAAAAPVVGLVMALAVAKEGGIVGLEEVVVDATTVIIHEKSDHLVVETSQEVTVVPYGDYFCVEGLWDVERDGDESEHCCILRVYVNVAFSKKTMWRDMTRAKACVGKRLWQDGPSKRRDKVLSNHEVGSTPQQSQTPRSAAVAVSKDKLPTPPPVATNTQPTTPPVATNTQPTPPVAPNTQLTIPPVAPNTQPTDEQANIESTAASVQGISARRGANYSKDAPENPEDREVIHIIGTRKNIEVILVKSTEVMNLFLMRIYGQRLQVELKRDECLVSVRVRI